MKKFSKQILLALLCLTVLAATACPKKVSIADIEANPSKFANRDIAVTGTVRDSYGINVPGTPLRGGAYMIDDGTGSIWVLTEDSVPSKGSQIGVNGRVGNGINWKGRNYGLGLYEKDRRFAKK